MKPLGALKTGLIRVGDLIDDQSNLWREDMIKTVLFAHAHAVLSMPRPRRRGEDIWSWSEEKTGLYSVKSAYRLLVRNAGRAEDIVGCSTVDSAGIWKKLRKLKVIPKVRVFWWRVLKQILPSFAELNRRHILENCTCKLCGYAEETLYHSLVQCDHAKQFWSVAQDHFEIKLPNLHPLSWAGDIITGAFFSAKDAALVVSIMWCIWSSRNSFVQGEQCYQPLKYFQLIEEHLANLELPVREKEVALPAHKWQKSPAGWHSVNTDGALDIVNSLAGSGFVIRDDAGAFVHAGFMKHDHVADPFVSEFLGCREGLEAVSRKGLRRVILQTDCSGIVSLWQDKRAIRMEGIHILNEMKELSSLFQEFKILFVKREANQVAHLCAREALNSVSSESFDVIPGFLIAALQSDCNPDNV